MMVNSKREARQRLRQRRDGMVASTRGELSSRIADHFLECPSVGQFERVALYAAIGSEVETADIFAGLRLRGTEVCFPRSRVEERLLEWCPVAELDRMQPGAHGVLEPVGATVELDSVDAVVLPGLGFDGAGWRVGYGAGYYDKTLAEYRGRCVGLAFDCQIVDRLPAEDHDRRMDVVVTESGATDVSLIDDSVSSLRGGPP